MNKEDLNNDANEQRNLKCKQSAKRTETEQAMDCMETFKIVHAAEKFSGNSSVLDIGLENEINVVFKDLLSRKILCLPLEKPIINFLISHPMNLTKAASLHIIQKGFLRNRMIDKESKVWPCLDGMMQTLCIKYSE